MRAHHSEWRYSQMIVIGPKPVIAAAKTEGKKKKTFKPDRSDIAGGKESFLAARTQIETPILLYLITLPPCLDLFRFWFLPFPIPACACSHFVTSSHHKQHMEKPASLEASAAAAAAAPASAVATGPGGGGNVDEHDARRISSAGQQRQQGQDRNRSHGTALRASIPSSSSSSAAAAGDGGGGSGRACGRSHGPAAAATSGAAAGPQPAAFDKDKDVGLTVVGERAQEYDPRVEARVLRKIDWFLMPTMIIGTSRRRIEGDENALGTTGDMTSNCGGSVPCFFTSWSTSESLNTKPCRSYCPILLARQMLCICLHVWRYHHH